MLYIPTKAEKQKAEEFLTGLKREGLDPASVPLNELLAMYAKELR